MNTYIFLSVKYKIKHDFRQKYNDNFKLYYTSTPSPFDHLFWKVFVFYITYIIYTYIYVCTYFIKLLLFDVKSNNFQQYNSHTHINNTSPYYLDFHIQTHLFSIPSFDMDYSPTMSHHLSILHSFHLHFHFFSNETHLSF